jgi:DNA-binding protein H-NS
MAKNYEQVIKQIESLKNEAEKLRRRELGEVVARIREAIAHYGLNATDLGLRGKPAAARPRVVKRKKSVVPVKYRDDAGHTWTGRGLKPIWLRDALAAGKSLKDFDVKLK